MCVSLQDVTIVGNHIELIKLIDLIILIAFNYLAILIKRKGID